MNSQPGYQQPKLVFRCRALLGLCAWLAISLACSFSLPFSVAPTPRAAVPEAPLGLIAYVGKDGNIYTVDRDGKELHAITRDANLKLASGQMARIYQFPTWAPDGQHLAFIRLSVSASLQEVSLFSALSDGQKPVNAFTSQNFQPFYLSWSPDSQTIAFLGNDLTGGLAQYLVAGSGGESRFISSGQPYYWDWSPDNRSLIVHVGGASSQNPDARLAIVGLGNSAQTANLDLKPGFFDAPAWSPAGDGLALATQNGAGEDELILAGQDGKLKRVLAKLSGPVAFAWSPKGVQLAYAVLDQSGSAATVRLFVLDSSQPAQQTEAAHGDLMAFFWSPDGQKIAYLVQGGGGPTASSVQLAAYRQQTVGLVVRIYDRVKGTTREIASFTPTDSFQQILPFYSQYQRSETIWSPDSQELVLSGVAADGQNAIYTVGVDGSHFQKIADGDLAFWSWK